MIMKKVNKGEHLLYSSRIVLLVLIFFLPLFFFPFTTDIFEINKQTLFLVLTFVSALLWIASMLRSKAVVFKRGWVNLFPVLLLVPFVVSALFSKEHYLSWVGLNGQEYTSVLSMFGLVVLFYLIVNLLSSKELHKKIHLSILVSAVLTGTIAILSIFNISLFSFDASASTTFNTIGTINSLAIFLIAMTMFASGVWVSHKKSDSLLHNGFTGFVEQLLIVLLHIMTFFILLVIDYWVLWLLFIVGFVILFVFITFRSSDFQGLSRTILPILAMVLAVPFWIWMRTPFGFELPTEVTPNRVASIHITKQTFNQYSKFYGSGPGTYQFNYTKFHGTNINKTDFWNLKFDKASSYFWTILPTVGGLGIAGFILFILSLGITALTQIFKTSNREWLQAFVAFCPWAILVLSACLYPFNITLTALLIIFSGLLGSQVIKKEKIIHFEGSAGFKFLFSFLFIFGAFIFFVGIFFSTQRYMAELSYTKAIKLDRANAPIEEVIKHLDRAASLNRYHDRYYRALSVSLLHRVNSEIADLDIARLEKEQRTYIQELVGASVNASIRATEISPSNVSNWLLRGQIYRELSSLVAKAGDFAIDANKKAVQLEPDNPGIWTELGKTYLIVADQNAFLLSSTNKETAAKAKEDMAVAYNDAEASFSKAIDLKPNYAPAFFAIGSLYEKQGKLTEAIKQTEYSLQFNKLDAGVFFKLGLLRLKRNAAGDVLAAEKAFEQAINLVPTYSNARWYLATVYEKQSDVKKAVGQIEKILEYNPENPQVKERFNRLLKGDLSNDLPEAIK